MATSPAHNRSSINIIILHIGVQMLACSALDWPVSTVDMTLFLWCTGNGCDPFMAENNNNADNKQQQEEWAWEWWGGPCRYAAMHHQLSLDGNNDHDNALCMGKVIEVPPNVVPPDGMLHPEDEAHSPPMLFAHTAMTMTCSSSDTHMELHLGMMHMALG